MKRDENPLRTGAADSPFAFFSRVFWRVSSVPLVLLSLLLPSGCRLFVDVPVAIEPKPAVPDIEPLTALELLRFSGDNLAEISPGLAYRSGRPSENLLRFLEERVGLGYVLSLIPMGEDSPIARLGTGPELERVRMPQSVLRPPTPREILQLIRVTLAAQHSGRSLLIHCRAGADRTGAMVAIWRMLFQGVTDREALEREAFLCGHVSPWLDAVTNTIATFRPELFRPFIENPRLLDDEDAILALEKRYFAGLPLESGLAGTPEGPLRAGMGKVDLLIGHYGPLQLATYGPSPGLSTGVRRHVFVRTLLLDNGARRIAIVAADLIIMDLPVREAVLDRLRQRGIEVDDLLLSATHTHTSLGGYVEHRPSEIYITGKFDPRMREHIVESVVRAVKLAQDDLAPAAIGAARSFVRLSANRRLGTTIDPELGVLAITTPEGTPRGVVVHYAAHPVLEPADATISADYPGLLARALDARYGFGLFLQGALGDLNARLSPCKDEWATEGLAERMAAGLLEAVEDAIPRAKPETNIALGSMTRLVPLPPVNVGFIPDLFFPLEWLIVPLLDWPESAILQTVRIGDVALVGSSSELGVRIGLRIERRSVAPYTWIVTHANDYSGYAVTAAYWPLSKLDPTSIPSLNGPLHGERIVTAAAGMLEGEWGSTLPADELRLSAAARELYDVDPDSNDPAERKRWAGLARKEAIEALEDVDITLPQGVRRVESFDDFLTEHARLEAWAMWVDDVRGGRGLFANREEYGIAARVQGPFEIQLSGGTSWLRSEWIEDGAARADEGFTDLWFEASRYFEVWRSEVSGSALRLAPIAGFSAPTGDADSTAPVAFTTGSGVWEARAGGAADFNWNVYRNLHLELLATVPVGRDSGRTPGEAIEGALGYTERHGAVSLALDLRALVAFADDRRGGRTSADLADTGFALSLHPGLYWHLFASWIPFVEGIIPCGHSGSVDLGLGVSAGVLVRF